MSGTSATHENAPAHTTQACTPQAAIEWYVDTPQPGERVPSQYEALVQGWMFAHDGSPVHGVIHIAEMPDVKFTQTIDRPDVVAHFRGRYEVALKCGFSVMVPLPSIDSAEVELSVSVALENCESSSPPVIIIRFRRAVALPWPARPLRTTLISHFYNEEYLLPLWLRHHLPLFDHGILINRGSTDRSVEICRELAPHWEVRDATCLEFDAEEVDQEVMTIEREITGWKFVLNTTEFLHVRSKDSFFSALHLWGADTYGVGMICLMDPKEAAYPEFDTSRPIAAQRHHGWHRPTYGYRYLHRCTDGNYTVGRHTTRHPSEVIPSQAAIILKLVLTPWNEPFKRRRLQIGPTLSAKSIALEQGTHHHVATEVELEDYYRSKIVHATDLHEQPGLEWLFAPCQTDHRHRPKVGGWRARLNHIITACSHAFAPRKRPDDIAR